MVSCKLARLGLLLLIPLVWLGCDHGVRPIEELVDIPRISKEALKRQLNTETTIIDVRYTPNWKKSDRKIVTAVRENPMELSTWVDRYPRDRRLVLYCD